MIRASKNFPADTQIFQKTFFCVFSLETGFNFCNFCVEIEILFAQLNNNLAEAAEMSLDVEKVTASWETNIV